MYYQSYFDAPIGRLLLIADEDSLCGLWIEGQKYFAATLSGTSVVVPDHPVLLRAKEWLTDYFAGARPSPADLSLNPSGSEFRKTVWKYLTEIPYGTVTTYSDIASKVAKEKGLSKMSAQAVGGAVGHNPISIIIPCHRVIGCNGSLTGYAGGIHVKDYLLSHEGIDTSHFIIPAKGTAL